jgi:hypothetical protein
MNRGDKEIRELIPTVKRTNVARDDYAVHEDLLEESWSIVNKKDTIFKYIFWGSSNYA